MLVSANEISGSTYLTVFLRFQYEQFSLIECVYKVKCNILRALSLSLRHEGCLSLSYLICFPGEIKVQHCSLWDFKRR
jgi:hypothetical protein